MIYQPGTRVRYRTAGRTIEGVVVAFRPFALWGVHHAYDVRRDEPRRDGTRVARVRACWVEAIEAEALFAHASTSARDST